MRGRKAAVTVYLSDDERQELQGLLRRQKTPLGLARRARAMLLLEQGLTYVQAAAQAGLSVRHLRKWANRFVPCRTPGLLDRPRPGRPPVFSPPGGGASGQDRLRDARPVGPLSVSMGLP
jgi:hypothetical protein